MANKLLDYDSFKQQINSGLAQFFAEKHRSLSWISDPAISSYINHVATITLAGGKRIRPYLAYLGYKISGGREYPGLMDACVVLELFHMFALIHDDIIDRADTRHGEQTIQIFVSPDMHYGESQAILVGDMVYTWAQELLMANTKKRYQTIVHKQFSQMVEEVIVGQMIDVSCTVSDTVTNDLISEKNRLKTARYSFVHPLCIGAALAGGASYNTFFESFGTTLGIGFQIQDDIIDIVGTTSGKPLMRDITEKQHTYLTQHVRTHGTDTDRALLRAMWGNPIDQSAHATIVELFERTGAIAHARAVTKAQIAESKRILASANIHPHYQRALESFVGMVESRSA